jgi:hypothetical protein
LQLSVSVDDGAAAVCFAVLDLVDEESLNVVWLLVAEQSRQVLRTHHRGRSTLVTVMNESAPLPENQFQISLL